MPRDSAGVFTLSPGYLAVTGQTIEASQHNPPLEDIAGALTGSLPRNGAAPMVGPLNMGGFGILNLPSPGAPADPATKAYVDAQIAALVGQIVAVPPGVIALYPGDVVPNGWLVCNGAAISRAGYPGLFGAINVKYGGGDGSTTFNLPEIRGEFPRFADLGRGIDGGRGTGSWQDQAFLNHNHGVNDPGHAHNAGNGLPFQTIGAGTGLPDYLGGNMQTVGVVVTTANGTNISIATAGGPETRPRNVAFIGVIKT